MLLLNGDTLTLDELLAVADRGEPVGIASDAASRVQASRAVVDARARGPEPAYGINTGFGSFAEVRIAPDQVEALQVNLLRSHAAGVGEPLPVRTVRAAMALRANVLAKGYSGIRLETLEALVRLLNAGVHPVVPCRGSVGASGDLAPLAHIALVLIGEGEAWYGGRQLPGAQALALAGLAPVGLGAKEGLALINGTQVSTALLGLALAGADQVVRAADIAAALSIDALRGSIHPFEARIHLARPFPGQLTAAANIERLMTGSRINASHQHCGKVQDAYSLRCAAQVHGAVRDALDFAHRTFDIEANAATDNPMVFADSGDIVSGGNFHGAPIAIAADLVSAALVPLATISERRSDRLVDPTLSGLPAFLTREGGLRSGLMMAQVTAAAVASELKTLATPAGIDTIPTSANKEDHVSMSTAAALKAGTSVARVREVLAVEILCGCQAIDLLAPLATSPALARVHELVRTRVAPLEDDRPPAPDLAAIVELIGSGALHSVCADLVK